MAQSLSDKSEAFAKNLKGIMKERGLTQNELALALNVPKSTVSAWCRGIKIPSTALIKELSKYFGIKKESLFRDERNEIDPIQIDTTDSKYVFDNEDAIVNNKKSSKKF